MGAPSSSTGERQNSSSVENKKNQNHDESDPLNHEESGDSINTYLSLIQQYLTMFQIDNAIWLAERCVAEYPTCEDAIYLLALCNHRSGKPKTARHILDNYNASGSQKNKKTTASMQYLSAQCSYELGDYSRGETALLKETRKIYKLANTSTNMDHWILQTTPCPIPNGAAGLALLGKICRKSNRKERSIKYFQMSLRLDPFLFTSFQALCELGVDDMDASEIFGGNPVNLRPRQSTQQNDLSFSATNTLQSFNVTNMKTPLQPMDMTGATATPGSTSGRQNARALAFDTPGLTPIAVNQSTAQTPIRNYNPRQKNNDSAVLSGGSTVIHANRHNPNIVRRARHVATRQYYPPSPDTTPAVSAVTRSMRYLRGLGVTDSSTNVSGISTTGRSLFQTSSSENQASNAAGQSSTADYNNFSLDNMNNAHDEDIVRLKPEKPESKKTSKKDDDENAVPNIGKVQDILDLLTVAGAAYQNICQYRCQEALQTLQQLPPNQLVTPWVLQQQGRVFLEQGDFQSAQRSLELMHKIDPSRMKGLELLSTVYWHLKKEMELANLAQNALDWDYMSPESHCAVGNCFSLQKDHETALVFFKRSLQLDPDFTYTHTLSGYEYMSNEDFDKAIACFRQALRTDERHYNAWYGLGAIYHRQEKFDLAEYHFERAVSIHPSSSVLRCNLGNSQFANGKAYQALETLSAAFQLDPGNPQARFQRATIYSALHRPEEALAELQAVRDCAPREATVHFAMGKVLKRLGRPNEAMKCFLTAMDLDPKDNQLIKSAMDKLDEPDVDEENLGAF